MITLALETSTSQGGVALFEDAALLFEETFLADRSHSSQLFAVLERALAIAGNPPRIVVGLGPGSYAGVRIAISAAIGLSVATGAELLGLPSVAALGEGEYLALGDARRATYYFARILDGDVQEGPLLLPRELLEARLAQSTLPLYSSEPLELGFHVELRYPSARRLAELALAGKSIHSRGALEPIYLREPHITLPRGPSPLL